MASLDDAMAGSAMDAGNGRRVKVAVDASMPFEHRMLERSSEWGVPRGGHVRTRGAEDLVVRKGFADRSQDWIDVENVICRQGNKLDGKLMLEELGYLAELKEQPELLHRLQSIFDKSN